MTGTVLQVSTSRGGIPKRALLSAVLTPTGVAGDRWRYPFHGGPKKAILLVTSEGVEELVAQGFPLFAGALGENITTRGLDRRTMHFGQRFRVGHATIELTLMRTPCATLNVYGRGIQAAMYDALAQAGDPASPVWGLSGFYASVITPGTVSPGDEVALISPPTTPLPTSMKSVLSQR